MGPTEDAQYAIDALACIMEVMETDKLLGFESLTVVRHAGWDRDFVLNPHQDVRVEPEMDYLDGTKN